MARLNSQIELDDVLQKDELEERQANAEINKQKKIRRKRRRRKLLLLSILILFSLYLFSDFSNIRVIDVKGNIFYTKKQLLEKAEISYSMKSILAPAFMIEKHLEDDPMIKNASVHKSWDGVVSIEIKEVNMVGYYTKDNKSYLIVKGEEDVYIKDESLLAYVPYINNLSKKERDEYKKSVDKVNKENVWMISEISHHETSYNKNMLKLVMQDGHVVYTSMKGLKLLDYYLEMLKALNTTHKCITFVEETNSSYSEKCE